MSSKPLMASEEVAWTDPAAEQQIASQDEGEIAWMAGAGGGSGGPISRQLDAARGLFRRRRRDEDLQPLYAGAKT
jgi:hypothetical protein